MVEGGYTEISTSKSRIPGYLDLLIAELSRVAYYVQVHYLGHMLSTSGFVYKEEIIYIYSSKLTHTQSLDNNCKNKRI